MEIARGVGKLSHFSLGLLLHSWCFPPFGVGEEDRLQVGGIDAKGRHNWSMEQLLRILGKGLHLLFGFYLFLISLICKT